EEPLRQHQLRQNRQLHIVGEASRDGRLVAQEKPVEETLDLSGIPLGSARENWTDLVAKRKGGLDFGSFVAQRRLDGLRVESSGLPWLLQQLPGGSDERRIGVI